MRLFPHEQDEPAETSVTIAAEKARLSDRISKAVLTSCDL